MFSAAISLSLFELLQFLYDTCAPHILYIYYTISSLLISGAYFSPDLGKLVWQQLKKPLKKWW